MQRGFTDLSETPHKDFESQNNRFQNSNAEKKKGIGPPCISRSLFSIFFIKFSRGKGESEREKEREKKKMMINTVEKSI